MTQRWIILTETLTGKEPAYTDGMGEPITYATEKDAQLALIEDWIETLQNQLYEFKEGQREFDEIDFNCQMWVEGCDIKDGVISIEDEVIYDPTNQTP